MKIQEIQLSYKRKINNIVKISGSKSAYGCLIENWNKDTIDLQEELKVLLMNQNNIVLGVYNMSKGGIAGTVADLKLLFSVVLKSAAVGFILSHNHPSGNLKPSHADNQLTSKIKKGARLFDLNFLDHIIVSSDGYYSYADAGEL